MLLVGWLVDLFVCLMDYSLQCIVQIIYFGIGFGQSDARQQQQQIEMGGERQNLDADACTETGEESTRAKDDY